MKNFLLNGFEDFITGSGIWILVGCLAFALLVSILFLILNIEKEKKMQAKKSTPIILTTEDEKTRTERIQPVEVKTSKTEEKVEEAKEEPTKEPVKKSTTKKTATKSTKETTKKSVKEEKVAETPETEKEEKVAEKKETAKKTTTKKVEPVKEEVKEETSTESGNYEISYNAAEKKWVVKRESNVRATKKTKTKQEAIDFAKPLAEKNEVKLIIHTKKD